MARSVKWQPCGRAATEPPRWHRRLIAGDVALFVLPSKVRWNGNTADALECGFHVLPVQRRDVDEELCFGDPLDNLDLETFRLDALARSQLAQWSTKRPPLLAAAISRIRTGTLQE